MGVRKNAKLLSATEIEDFVKACVLMKADIVNPGDPLSSQYSRWDEMVAIHRMIQNANAPATSNVNFGHGGTGAYSFLSWHRYFLYQFELQLQSYVPGVMLPYWDWTDPASIMTETFLGPDGSTGDLVPLGYFAFDQPGSGTNTTILPAWWPAGLAGWRLPDHFPSTWRGGLKRNIGGFGSLPSSTDLHEALAKTDYHAFQNAVESGSGISSGHQMHNGMHVWVGGHMSSVQVSPFDPLFYLHHCNIDRLWAMWQLDGHATEYPSSGGKTEHHRTDIMYPWVGATAGYSSNISYTPPIPMPDFSALGVQRNEDTLDFRTAYNYTYDTIAIIGIGLDQTGSMNGLTPDPMVTTDPDVTKWEAARRGVSAFLQDCETVQDSGTTYIMAGIKTFRATGAGNIFTPLFGAPGYGLIKAGTSFSKSGFETSVAALSPGGSTPLADALADIQTTIVEPPFGGLPADEQRYLAMLSDGILTSGSPMSSIADGSYARTAIFGMGFGSGAEVDYATIAGLVAKGKTLSSTQVFHGESAGVIDKFYSNALAAAIGFTTVFDPVIELFEGEHTHVDYYATSADDVFMITAQGMDFNDSNWEFHLHGPGGQLLYGKMEGHGAHSACHHCCPPPVVTAKRSNGRLSLVVQRGTASKACWVGLWRLMISYKARDLSVMMMPEIGEWLFPVAAGPVRGSRYARLLIHPKQRVATRNMVRKPLHGLDLMPVSTNNNNKTACSMLVNIYARTNLKLELLAASAVLKAGEELKISLSDQTPFGRVHQHRVFARLVAPQVNLAKLLSAVQLKSIRETESKKQYSSRADAALLLARIEKSRKQAIRYNRDEEVKMVQHEGGPWHLHEKNTQVPGVYHIGAYVEGSYIPDNSQPGHTGGHDHGTTAKKKKETGPVSMEGAETFTRLLNLSVAVTGK